MYSCDLHPGVHVIIKAYDLKIIEDSADMYLVVDGLAVKKVKDFSFGNFTVVLSFYTDFHYISISSVKIPM